MTTLIGWVGIDSRGPTSLYFASDSRISWESERTWSTWDFGRKLFASRNYPEILAYCGDVVFPTQALGQVIDLIDNNLCICNTDSPEVKKDKIFAIIKESFSGYPLEQSREFTIAYCTRQNEGMDSTFHLACLKWTETGWSDSWLEPPDSSGLIEAFGTGKQFVKESCRNWSNATGMRTSRGVFSALCDSIDECGDRYTGGAPQLVGLYRKGNAESFGIIYKDKRYLLGLPVEASSKCANVEWRNSLFERCDWQTMAVLEKAQKHSRPKGLR